MEEPYPMLGTALLSDHSEASNYWQVCIESERKISLDDVRRLDQPILVMDNLDNEYFL